jgi:hypothetical protein
MSFKKLILIVTTGLLIPCVSNAQETSATPAKDANEIFNSILQTMPKDMKLRVDSASVIQKSQKENGKKIPAQSNSEKSKLYAENKNASLDKLPDEVRQQVLKTMQEIEQQKMERMIEFKESKEQKNGK